MCEFTGAEFTTFKITKELHFLFTEKILNLIIAFIIWITNSNSFFGTNDSSNHRISLNTRDAIKFITV